MTLLPAAAAGAARALDVALLALAVRVARSAKLAAARMVEVKFVMEETLNWSRVRMVWSSLAPRPLGSSPAGGRKEFSGVGSEGKGLVVRRRRLVL